MDKIKRIKELVEELNKYRDYYYNHDESLVSDQMYDALFDELVELEEETGYYLPNSPTQSVGYEVSGHLEEVVHNHPMLSLGKTKSADDIYKFIKGREGLLMLKMDGLTVSACYENGKLKSAETRGNGVVGENVLANMKVVKNIPLEIPYEEKLIIDGEIIVTYKTFNEINKPLPEDKKFKHVRNLAAGSIRQLDNNIAAERNMLFIPWKCIEGSNEDSFIKRLEFIKSLGFTTVPFIKLQENVSKDELIKASDELKQIAKDGDFPIDGLVISYDSVSYGDSLGATEHHVRSQLAWKDLDISIDTVLREVEWSASRTGLINPVAIFDTIKIEGTDVSRASLHNLSIIKSLKLGIGDKISVTKANLIIPKVTANITKSDNLEIPDSCPVCNAKTIRKENEDKTSEFLYCSNPDCPAKRIGLFEHFVSRDAMNIDGLSTATLEKFIELGFIKSLSDIYSLSSHHNTIVQLEGFGEKSFNNLMKAIEKSKDTTFSKFLYSLGIPNVGKDASKRINEELEKMFQKQIGEKVEKNIGKEIIEKNIKKENAEDNIGKITGEESEKTIGKEKEDSIGKETGKESEKTIRKETIEEAIRNGKTIDDIENERVETESYSYFSLTEDYPDISIVPFMNERPTKVRLFFNLLDNEEHLQSIDGIGPVTVNNIIEYFKEEKNKLLFSRILSFINLKDNIMEEKEEKNEEKNLKGLVFVITGSVEKFKNREEIKEEIEKRGGKVAGSVSSKTSYLINNDTESSSSKNKKAKELGVKIISELDFLELINKK